MHSLSFGKCRLAARFSTLQSILGRYSNPAARRTAPMLSHSTRSAVVRQLEYPWYPGADLFNLPHRCPRRAPPLHVARRPAVFAYSQGALEQPESTSKRAPLRAVRGQPESL